MIIRPKEYQSVAKRFEILPTSTATGGNMRQFNASVLTDFIGDGNKPEDDNLRGEEMSGKQRAGIIKG